MRVLEEPHDRLAWVQARQALDKGAVEAAIQLYSGKTQLTMKQVSSTPRTWCCSMRPTQHAWQLGSYSPSVDIVMPLRISNVKWRLIKMKIIHACPHVLLAPLKQLGRSGIIMSDPSRQHQNVSPWLLMHDHACTYSSAKAQMPHAICDCPRDQLS